MSTVFNYLEWVNDGASPSNIGFSLSSGQATEVYLIQNIVTYDQLVFMFQELVGSVTSTTTSGALQRSNPVRHPVLPFYCVGVSSAAGYGQPYIPVANPPQPFIPEITYWCLYPNQRIQASFQPLPYPVLSDQVIGNSQAGAWFKDDGTLEEFEYWREWERNVDFIPDMTDDNVVQQQGRMAFNGASLPADARPFMAQPRLYLNNEKISFIWYNVPFSYITSNNSYLKRFRGRVNQNIWQTSTMGNYGAGELLYLGYKVKKYTPPFGNNNYTYPGTNIREFEKWCDIELHFMHTQRPLGDLPLYNPALINGNYVAGGFNLNPFIGNGTEPLSRTFIYTSTSPIAGANSTPCWLSFPVEILFSNPDFEGAI